MKQIFSKVMLAAAGTLLVVSCNKDGDQTIPFSSELIGTYTPVITSDPESVVLSGDMFVNAEWTDEANVPMIDMSFMGEPGTMWPGA